MLLGALLFVQVKIDHAKVTLVISEDLGFRTCLSLHVCGLKVEFKAFVGIAEMTTN